MLDCCSSSWCKRLEQCLAVAAVVGAKGWRKWLAVAALIGAEFCCKCLAVAAVVGTKVGVSGWCSGENTSLPTIPLGFDSQIICHM